jgi:hypothetical protein
MPQSALQKAIQGIAGAAKMGVHILLPFLHRWRTTAGATQEELRRTWLGDEVVPQPCGGFTHGITIHAPAEKVWGWVVQISQEKGGFYSYEFLENLVGCNIHNAERIHPEWQVLKVGDVLYLHPQAMPIPITAVEEGKGYLCSGVMDAEKGQPVEEGKPLPRSFMQISWLFYVYESTPGETRFISRWRINYLRNFRNDLMFGLWFFEPVAVVMDFGMLRGVKQRAEASL